VRTGLVVTVGLLAAALAAPRAVAQEEPQRPLMRVFAARQAPRQALDTVAQLGEAIPAVREELARHRKAMTDVLAAHLTLANEIDKALRELREAGAEEAELEAAATKFAPQAGELAAQRAAELATHYANLAKILNPEDEAKRKEVVKQLAEGLIRRMAAEPEPPEPPAFGPPGGIMRRFPGGFGPGGRDRDDRGPGDRGGERNPPERRGGQGGEEF